jgi:uncharacterized membrane protein
VSGGRSFAGHRTLALVQLGGGVVGIVVALYLTWVKLADVSAVCLPGGGCETVAQSEYSSILGIPVAVLGAGFSVVLLAVIAAWWRRLDRRLLYAAYALGLFGIVFVAYLTYLELFVIHAICTWCATYAISVVVTWVATALTLRAVPEA